MRNPDSRPAPQVRLTEGELKADVAMALSDIPTIGIAGVNNWSSALPVLEGLEAETVRLAFDADMQTKPHVARCCLECASTLRDRGYTVLVETWDISQGKGIDDLLAGGGVPETVSGVAALDYLRNLATVTTEPEIPVPGVPSPVEGIVPPVAALTAPTVMPFPIEVFPEPLVRYAEQAAESLVCPIDLVAMPMLGIAATAIGASRAVQLKRRWFESPRLYLATIAPPGSGKSPAESLVSRHIFHLQNRFRMEFRDALSQLAPAERQHRSETPHRGQRQQTDQEPRPLLRRIVVSDATVESLAPLLLGNPRGVLMIRDELVSLVRSLNQYKGGKGADRQFYLSTWSGQAVVIDRKLQSEPIIVPRPFLNILGGIQPDMLFALRDEQGRSDGFIDRILFAFPDEFPPQTWTDREIEPEVELGWTNALDRLFTLAMQHNEREGIDLPVTVYLTDDARACWIAWFNAMSSERESSGLSESLNGPWKKMVSYGLRLALVIHLLRFVCGEASDEDIDDESMRRAIRLMAYFQSHAKKVYRHLDRSPSDRRNDAVLLWILGNGGESTARDLQRANVGGINRASLAVQTLRDLVDHGFGILETRRAENGRTVTYFRATVRVE